MKVYDENGNMLESYDANNGYLVEEKRFVAHHDAIPAQKEVGHYEVDRVYPNGGKDLKWIIDSPGSAEIPAWDEYETVYVFHENDPVDEDNTPSIDDKLAALLNYFGVVFKETSPGVLEVVKKTEFPEGDYLNPIMFTSGIEVTSGLWYTDGNDIWEAIKTGVPNGFDDTEYFDIIMG